MGTGGRMPPELAGWKPAPQSRRIRAPGQTGGMAPTRTDRCKKLGCAPSLPVQFRFLHSVWLPCQAGGSGILACQFTGHPWPVFLLPPRHTWAVGTGGKDAARTGRLEARPTAPRHRTRRHQGQSSEFKSQGKRGDKRNGEPLPARESPKRSHTRPVSPTCRTVQSATPGSAGVRPRLIPRSARRSVRGGARRLHQFSRRRKRRSGV